MKRLNKYISLGAVALMGASLVACDDTKDNDFVQEYDGPAGVYFSNTENAYLELDSDKNTISYPVYRDVAGAELTVGIEVVPVENYSVKDIYTFPSSVTFQAGSKVADLVIGYDISKAAIGAEQQYEVTLDAESTPFSSNSVVITLVNPAPWVLLGTNGKYTDTFWGVTEDYGPGPVTVSVWQEEINKNHFRISNPYIELNGEENSYFEFYVVNEGDVAFGQQITYNNLVVYDMFFVEYSSDYGADLYLAFPYLFSGFENQSNWVHNRVAQYQDNGLPGYITISPMYYFDGLGGMDQTRTEPIQITFPNYTVLDTTLEVTYEGTLTPSSQIQQILLSVDLGSDITSARAAVAPGTNGDALIQAIQNKTVDYTEFNGSGNVKVDFGNDNPTGDYVAAVVAYVGDEVKATQAVDFFYISTGSDYDPNKGWNSLGYVDYTDAYVCACPTVFLSNPIQTYSVEMQESEEKPGLYRLVNPYGAAYPYSGIEEDNPYQSYYLYIDATNPNKVQILSSPQNLPIYALDNYNNEVLAGVLTECWGMVGYFLDNGLATEEQIASSPYYYGKMQNGKITFPEGFYVDPEPGEIYGSYVSSLVAYWELPDEPQYSGYFPANVVMDYNIYESTEGMEQYLHSSTNPGFLYAPFMIDMSKITKVNNYRVNGQVMLSKKAMSIPGVWRLPKVHMMEKPNLKESSSLHKGTVNELVPRNSKNIRVK